MNKKITELSEEKWAEVLRLREHTPEGWRMVRD